jgi:hypothetical protein
VCHVVSKAFSISKNKAAVDILLLKFKVTWSASLIYCKVVLWRARKPNWHALSKCFSLMCFWTICKITFSNSLPVENNRMIGRKFWGNLGFLPGFGKVTTLAFAFETQFYILDPWFLATISSSFSYTSKDGLEQVYHCLNLTKWSYSSTACMQMQYWLW